VFTPGKRLSDGPKILEWHNEKEICVKSSTSMFGIAPKSEFLMPSRIVACSYGIMAIYDGQIGVLNFPICKDYDEEYIGDVLMNIWKER